MRGAIYSRVSTLDQDYKRQTNELKEYAQYMGIEITHVFEERKAVLMMTDQSLPS